MSRASNMALIIKVKFLNPADSLSRTTEAALCWQCTRSQQPHNAPHSYIIRSAPAKRNNSCWIEPSSNTQRRDDMKKGNILLNQRNSTFFPWRVVTLRETSYNHAKMWAQNNTSYSKKAQDLAHNIIKEEDLQCCIYGPINRRHPLQHTDRNTGSIRVKQAESVH